MDDSFAGRLRQLCDEYYYDYMDTPPCPVSSYNRMNSLLEGTRKPTMDELVQISEAFDVSINYLLTGGIRAKRCSIASADDDCEE